MTLTVSVVWDCHSSESNLDLTRFLAMSNQTHCHTHTHSPQCSQYTRRAEPMTTGSLHRLPLGQKADWTLKSLLQWRFKFRIITLHYDPVDLLINCVAVVTVRRGRMEELVHPQTLGLGQGCSFLDVRS
jgi:hypothetical protein